MNSSAADNRSKASCEFQDNLEILRQIDFFAGLPIETLKIFAYLCSRETYQTGDYLFVENDDDGQAFYLISGQAVLMHGAEVAANEVRIFASGQFLGSLALLGSMPRLFSLKAVEPVQCLILSREKFTKAIEQFPELMPRLLKSVVAGIRSWEKGSIRAIAEQGETLRGMAGISAL